ncbi:hypothetical protein CONCODRAFT_13302 [Conidiobolus coronatus NRRL 28638]|uniref:Uncharacterized protein n=1 Tax=Conidiobolus coronatus (strain ATCC 28846 / CBS 209.66 / NRRL 28638) TaxID=796925 RepID=A0A137NR04_CONC2|nr:hypothetical protein CONCODRAFT_13302 [Conidiobolus coronatus NRRL 28638]|eukprot:KXN65197.1 hypothetical protein CONCODRAFT_13302 [Conidiobolus coronatus NRRL 28638]
MEVALATPAPLTEAMGKSARDYLFQSLTQFLGLFLHKCSTMFVVALKRFNGEWKFACRLSAY